MKIRVRCILEVEIDWPDDPVPESFESLHDWLIWVIEENGCPGTGSVGRAIDDAYEKGQAARTCWACELNGRNELIREHT